MKTAIMLEAALAYIAEGFRIFPVKPDKKPLTEHGLLDATKTEAGALEYWTRWPNAGIGLVTDGLIVLDFDVKHGGLESRTAIEAQYGPLPRTRTHRTGGGGLHYIYRNQNGTDIRNTVALGGYQGIDLRANGGYILVPPSPHENGGRYEVVDSTAIAPAPEWLMELAPRRVPALAEAIPKGQPILEGQRNHHLTSLGGSMRRSGMPPEAIEAALLEVNRRQCQPPLPDAEVLAVSTSVGRYPQGEVVGTGHKGIVELPPLDHANMPELPEVVWKGLFDNYRALMAPTTEAPDAYHFAVFSTVLGATFGRRISVYHAVPLYSNFFVALVGPTGISRKDTAWSRGRTILQRLHANEASDDANPGFQIIPGVGSAEGLLDALAGEDKVVILNEAELLSLLAKARQEGLGNLIPKLTSLYDCPEVETLKTRINAVVCRRPFLSIISGTTTPWLHKALTARDIYGGFANRFVYVLGTPKTPMPYPPAMDTTKLDKLISDINDVRTWIVKEGGGSYPPTEEAKATFAEYYAAFHQRCVTDSIISALIQRMQSHAWKLALLYAALHFETTIENDHILAGIAAANFFEASARAVFLNFPGTLDLNEKENRLVSLLEKAGGPVARREIYRRLNWSAKELNEVTTNLIRVGLLKPSLIPTTSGPPIDCLESTRGPT